MREQKLELDITIMGPIFRIPMDLHQEWQLNLGTLHVKSVDTYHQIQLTDFVFMYKNDAYEYYLMENKQLTIDINLREKQELQIEIDIPEVSMHINREVLLKLNKIEELFNEKEQNDSVVQNRVELMKRAKKAGFLYMS